MTAGDRILLLGGGNMGGALVRGWIGQDVDPASILVVDPAPGETLRPLIEAGTLRHATSVPAEPADIVVVAVKPQMMETALPPLRAALTPKTLVISIAAGKTIAYFERALGLRPIVRAMPNTPALIGRGISGCFANAAAGEADRRAAETLLAGSGPVVWLSSEGDLDAVTALSGGGPAYVFLLTEALAKAGEAAGLEASLAMQLARHTVAGAGELMIRSEDTPEKLRRNVTSPNGTTLAALNVLMAEDGIGPLVERAIAAAKRRSEELSRD